MVESCVGFDWFRAEWVMTPAATYLGIATYAALALFLWMRAKRAR